MDSEKRNSVVPDETITVELSTVAEPSPVHKVVCAKVDGANFRLRKRKRKSTTGVAGRVIKAFFAPVPKHFSTLFALTFRRYNLVYSFIALKICSLVKTLISFLHDEYDVHVRSWRRIVLNLV